MLKVEAIKDSAFAGPLLILVNLSMALALICAVLYGGAKMEVSVARDDSTKELAKEMELIQRGSDDSRGWSVFEDTNAEKAARQLPGTRSVRRAALAAGSLQRAFSRTRAPCFAIVLARGNHEGVLFKPIVPVWSRRRIRCSPRLQGH